MRLSLSDFQDIPIVSFLLIDMTYVPKNYTRAKMHNTPELYL